MPQLDTELKISECIDNPEDKKVYNKIHFTESASRYDFATKALSLGRDLSWKKWLVDMLPEISKPVCIDLACGTGDVSFLLAERYTQSSVVGVDLTQAMLDIAEKRNNFENIVFKCGDMCELSAADNSIDIVTGSYALRNAPELSVALKEVHRVLKKGGVAAFLDFSKPNNKLFQTIQYWVLKAWGSFWGLMLHGNRQVHGYISESIKTYPDGESLKTIIEKEGFQIKERKQLFFGMTEILVTEKV